MAARSMMPPPCAASCGKISNLFKQIKPGLIVADFRLSLPVCARSAGISYIGIASDYWSPFYAERGFPLPVPPMTRFLPLSIAEALFNLERPMAFGLHCNA